MYKLSVIMAAFFSKLTNITTNKLIIRYIVQESKEVFTGFFAYRLI